MNTRSHVSLASDFSQDTGCRVEIFSTLLFRCACEPGLLKTLAQLLKNEHSPMHCSTGDCSVVACTTIRRAGFSNQIRLRDCFAGFLAVALRKRGHGGIEISNQRFCSFHNVIMQDRTHPLRRTPGKPPRNSLQRHEGR